MVGESFCKWCNKTNCYHKILKILTNEKTTHTHINTHTHTHTHPYIDIYIVLAKKSIWAFLLRSYIYLSCPIGRIWPTYFDDAPWKAQLSWRNLSTNTYRIDIWKMFHLGFSIEANALFVSLFKCQVRQLWQSSGWKQETEIPKGYRSSALVSRNGSYFPRPTNFP